jgi:hypothetical protein
MTETEAPHRTFWGTVFVACIPLVPAVLVMGVQQIKNNERQDAMISANALSVQRLRDYVDLELAAIETTGRRNTFEHDRAQERLILIDQRLSATEATIKALQAKP